MKAPSPVSGLQKGLCSWKVCPLFPRMLSGLTSALLLHANLAFSRKEKIRLFLRQRSRFGCKIRHKWRSFQLQAKWRMFLVLSATQNNLRLIFFCSLGSWCISRLRSLELLPKWPELWSSVFFSTVSVPSAGWCTSSCACNTLINLFYVETMLVAGTTSVIGDSPTHPQQNSSSWGSKKAVCLRWLICVKRLARLGTRH